MAPFLTLVFVKADGRFVKKTLNFFSSLHDVPLSASVQARSAPARLTEPLLRSYMRPSLGRLRSFIGDARRGGNFGGGIHDGMGKPKEGGRHTLLSSFASTVTPVWGVLSNRVPVVSLSLINQHTLSPLQCRGVGDPTIFKSRNHVKYNGTRETRRIVLSTSVGLCSPGPRVVVTGLRETTV
jgi:hypothetical protein